MHHQCYTYARWLALAYCGILLAGCGSTARADRSADAALPTPTIAGLFREAAPTPTAFTATARNTATPAAPRRAPTPTAPRDATQFKERTVYDEELNPKWDLTHSDGMEYDLAATQYVSNGEVAMVVTPTKDFSTLFFTVREESDEQYEHARVLGLQFWLNGGPDGLRTSDLAVSVVGSNALPFWAADDDSVEVTGRTTQDMPLFPETRLYYLGINRDIPPETWTKVEVWLEDLQFVPDYTYVTGFLLKNDKALRTPFYVDQMSLIVAP